MTVNRLEFMPVSAELRAAFNPFPAGPPAPGPEGPFRIGELSRHSGVPVGTIKYYLREGLLQPGRPTARTQALYGAEHLRRLRVIDVLADVGGLSIAQLRRVTALIDAGEAGEPDADPIELTRAVSYELPSSGRSSVRGAADRGTADDAEAPGARERANAREATDGFVAMLGLEVDATSPARADLADALLALRRLGIASDPMTFYEHARLAYELAELEIASSGPVEEPAASAEAVTVGSVVFGAAFMALRRMSHEHEMRRRAGRPVGSAPRDRPQAELDSGPRPG